MDHPTGTFRLVRLAQTRQADRDKLHGERIDKRHTALEEAAKVQTDKLVTLLQSNTALTEQDRDLTDEVVKLTREIHAAMTKKE